MAELQKKISIWTCALESKGLKKNLVRTNVMVSMIGQISIKPSSKIDLCGRKTMANAELCKICIYIYIYEYLRKRS